MATFKTSSSDATSGNTAKLPFISRVTATVLGRTPWLCVLVLVALEIVWAILVSGMNPRSGNVEIGSVLLALGLSLVLFILTWFNSVATSNHGGLTTALSLLWAIFLVLNSIGMSATAGFMSVEIVFFCVLLIPIVRHALQA